MSCEGRIQTFLEALASALYVENGQVFINIDLLQSNCQDAAPLISCGNNSVTPDIHLLSAIGENDCGQPSLRIGMPEDIDLSVNALTVEEIDTNTLTSGEINTDTIISDSDLTIETATEKTIVLSEVVWDDLRITPGSFDRPGGADPSVVLVYPNGGGIGTYLYEFAKDDVASFVVQLPHGYSGGNIKVHIHWTPGSRGVAENGKVVAWKIHYTWVNIGDNFADMQVLDLSDACDGVNYKHQMTSEVTIAANKNISSMLLCNIQRTTAGDSWSSTNSGQLPLILEVDFHYPIDTIGSRTSSSK